LNVVDALDAFFSVMLKKKKIGTHDFKKRVFSNGSLEKDSAETEANFSKVKFFVVNGDWVVILDEYDNPIHNAYGKDFHKDGKASGTQRDLNTEARR
jgi:hypothetical protein